MKRYLLDTSPLAAYLQNQPLAVRLIRPLIKRHEVATSIIVYAEVTEYLQGLPDALKRQVAGDVVTVGLDTHNGAMKHAQELLSTQDFVREIQADKEHLRLYVERGLLPRPRRQGRVSHYRHEHLTRLQLVLRLIGRAAWSIPGRCVSAV